ncbi:MAG: circularly permuted type 2 ATP-grasp protein [Acidimicrobiia bacterium]|nr:circularly permuted type 2 ATP-grasp protein [Acidimicrobiia bacterium]
MASREPLPVTFASYRNLETYDELIQADGQPRPAATALVRHLESISPEELRARQDAAERGIETAGITFTVYSQGQGIDRSWPFDIVPRVIDRHEWDRTEAGLVQRLSALNHFIGDVYGDRKIIKDGIVPTSLVEESPGYLPECQGIEPIHGVWAHICGSDLVRGSDGTLYVLEDNLRVPSGVSYMIENRMITKKVFAELFAAQSILPVDAYPDRLLRMLSSLGSRPNPVVAVLTPGIYNSAYFEHSFLARQMGIELVEGRDLFVEDDVAYLRTIEGPVRVDVLYRRVDDRFLDPMVFNPDSLLGAPGLMSAWRAGNLALANAPGTGVADDKVVYSYVPDMIRYYLNQEPLIENVPTYRCVDDDHRDFVLSHLDDLVVKPANESGGYGIVIGPSATQDVLAETAAAIEANPRNFVAQPVISLSTVPTLCDGVLQPRHVDLRSFTLQGAETYVACGGLTRVAMVERSLVVNSSQGGGSKDTWLVDTDARVATEAGTSQIQTQAHLPEAQLPEQTPST